jgi:hypothetical protein
MGMYDTYEDDDEGMEDGGNDNSSTIKQVRQALAKANKRIKELESANTDLSKSTRERSVKDVLTTKGLNPKIAAFVPEGLIDEAEIAKWIDENADVFGGAAPSSDAPTMDEQSIGALQAMDRTTSGGAPPQGQEALLERVKTMPYDELMLLIGGETG